MSGKTTRRRGEKPASLQTVKVTLRLTIETAQRLGVEASMRRVTQSAVAEGVLAPYLARWRLPSTIEGDARASIGGGGAGQGGEAA